MIDVDGVVGGLVKLVEDAHATACLSCSGEDGSAELVLSDHLRAGEGEEDAAGGYLLKRLGIEPGIALQRIVEGTAVLGKGRRVEDNQIVCECGA